MHTVTKIRTIEDYAAELRQIAEGDDSYENLTHLEACAMDRVEFAADPNGDTDAERLAEIRNVIAALKIVRAERRERLGR